MDDLGNKVDRWDHDDLQRHVWDLESKIEKLELALTLITNDLNTIKMEGCYRFVEDKNHKHE